MKLLNVYPRWNIEPVKAQGCKIYDRDGVEYLDFYGGHAVISIGHSHPEYVRRIKQQIDKIGFYSNSVLISLQDEYAEKLGNVSAYPDYSLFMVNSGAEANENALKLAAFHNRGKKVVAFRKSFHGRTSATVRVTDISRYWSSIDGVSEVVFLSLGDTDSLKEELGQGDVSSVIIEGIQGVGGVIVPDIKFFQDLRIVCDQTDTVLILDEIQSGFGRSGRFFAHQYAGIRPDLITVAKGMGNGFPVSGVLVSPKFAAVMGQLGTTFGGNHLACMAGIAVLDVMEKENLVMNSDRVGRYLMDKLKKLPKVKEVRGLGLMIGIEFEEPIEALRDKLLFEQKVFTGATGAHVFRLLPPLCLNKELADEFLDRFCRVLLR
ncbi:MAG: aminotransferase class III-fold pyridoxal phosphate-dependent enzyme [Candidatus Azobacteroides pseudotrichonymphae]|jgi:acetylornithine aminotransferase|nr:MAG: aminotransferase class III-fold pyridoxal phosphate-dependent enzyme [Candidatus Azobacteroides pseudotrichonymphae]